MSNPEFINIRFFISSTFQGLQEERNLIVQEIFPKIKEEVESRGIPFSWCDLRFGVSQFCSQERILRLCIQNIADCSPFFIGIFGESYGSIPKDLNLSQISRLEKSYNGIKQMLASQLSFTDIEMRYYLSNLYHNTVFSLFYDKGQWNESQDKKLKRKFEDWKTYVSSIKKIKPFHISPEKSFSQLSVDLADLLQYLPPKCEHAYEKLIYNEQRFYHNYVISHYYDINPALYKQIYECLGHTMSILVCNNDNNLLTRHIGKTYITAKVIDDYLRQSSYVCVYYYAGISRNFDTPASILRNLLYQACLLSGDSFTQYQSRDDTQELKDALANEFAKIEAPILVFIDGIDKNHIYTSAENLAIFPSWFPPHGDSVKYVFTSDSALPNEYPIQQIPISLDETIKTNFINSWLWNSYQIKPSSSIIYEILYYDRDLSYIRMALEEALICHQKIQKSGIESIMLDLGDSIYSRINKDLFENNNLIGVNIKSIRTALIYLALIQNGIIESDLIEITNIYNDWTILYSNIAPYLETNQYLRLNENLATAIIENATDIKTKRRELALSLEKKNNLGIYTLEILHQFKESNAIEDLIRFIAKEETFTYISKFDKGIFTEYFNWLEKEGKLIDVIKSIERTILSIPDESNAVSKALHFAKLFIYDFPRLAISEQFIEFIEKELAVPENLKENINIAKAQIWIEAANFSKAQDILSRCISLSSNQIMSSNTYKVLFLQAKILDNEYQSEKDQLAATHYYDQIICNNGNNCPIEIYIASLFKILRLLGPQSSRWTALYKNLYQFWKLIPIGSKYYYKYIHEMYILDGKNKGLQPSDAESFLSKFKKIETEIINIYGECPNQCEILLYLKELTDQAALATVKYKLSLYKGMAIDKSKAILEDTIKIYRLSEQYAQRYLNVSAAIYGKESLSYAKAAYSIANAYSNLSILIDELYGVFQSDSLLKMKEEYRNQAIEYGLSAEQIWKQSGVIEHRLWGKLCHNLAGYYADTYDYDNAIKYIEKSIYIKRKFCDELSESLYKSQWKKYTIYLKYYSDFDILDSDKNQTIQSLIVEIDILQQTIRDNWQQELLLKRIEELQTIKDKLKQCCYSR